MRVLTIAIVILGLVGLTFLFLPKLNQLRNMQKQKDGLEQENKEMERKISELKQVQEKFNTDPAFVERMGREAGLVKSNEVIFRLSETPGTK